MLVHESGCTSGLQCLWHDRHRPLSLSKTVCLHWVQNIHLISLIVFFLTLRIRTVDDDFHVKVLLVVTHLKVSTKFGATEDVVQLYPAEL